VNSAAIESSIEMGATTVDAVREDTGAASGCGKCQFKVNGLIQATLSNSDCLKQATN